MLSYSDHRAAHDWLLGCSGGYKPHSSCWLLPLDAQCIRSQPWPCRKKAIMSIWTRLRDCAVLRQYSLPPHGWGIGGGPAMPRKVCIRHPHSTDRRSMPHYLPHQLRSPASQPSREASTETPAHHSSNNGGKCRAVYLMPRMPSDLLEVPASRRSFLLAGLALRTLLIASHTGNHVPVANMS